MPQLISQQSKISPSKLTRNVTEDDKRLLKKKLVNLQQDMLKEVQLEKMVTCPNIVLEFNMFHINQVLDSCHCCLRSMMLSNQLKYGGINMQLTY